MNPRPSLQLIAVDQISLAKLLQIISHFALVHLRDESMAGTSSFKATSKTNICFSWSSTLQRLTGTRLVPKLTPLRRPPRSLGPRRDAIAHGPAKSLRYGAGHWVVQVLLISYRVQTPRIWGSITLNQRKILLRADQRYILSGPNSPCHGTESPYSGLQMSL